MFSYTFPSRIMVAVEMALRTSLVAVPLFIRVDPMIGSGPTSGQMATSTSSANWLRGLHVTNRVRAPISRARATAPTT